MTWVEYNDWMEFYRLEPWGCEVEDDRWTKLFNAAAQVDSKNWVNQKMLFPRKVEDYEQEKAKAVHDLEARLRGAFFEHNANVKVRNRSATDK